MALESNCAGDIPQVAPTAFVHPTATLIGHIIIEDRVFIGPNAVLRADEPGRNEAVQPIVIGEESNVQDNVIIHALGNTGVTVGPKSSVAHGAIVHGPCEVGPGCFIGFNSVVFKSILQAGVVVMHQALVEGVMVPDGLMVPSMTAVRDEDEVARLQPVTEQTVIFTEEVARMNVFLTKSALERAQ